MPTDDAATCCSQYRVLFALLAGTGMRISEAAGLRVDDLDPTNCVIRIRRGIVEGIEQPTKTPSGERIIDIAPELAALLQQHLAGRKSGRVLPGLQTQWIGPFQSARY